MSILKLQELVDSVHRKEADEVMGYPSMNPPQTPGPIPGEEGAANPAQKAQERANMDPLDEALGDTQAEVKQKLLHRLAIQAGAEQEAVSKAEDPKELVDATQAPTLPQTVATPAAPPATGGPTPAPPVGDAKMGEYFEQKGNELLLQAKEAADQGDAIAAAQLKAKADMHFEAAQDHNIGEASKQASAQQLLLDLLSDVRGDDNGQPKEASAPEAPTEGEMSEEEYYNKIADDYEGAGAILGTKAGEHILAAHAQGIEESLEAHEKWASERLPALVEEALRQALGSVRS